MLSGRLRAHLIRLIGDREGVSAIEFSVIAPILLLILMGSIELPRAYMIGKRLDNAAATMADLISRGSYADLKPVFAATSAISNPYDVSRASIVLTAAGTYSDGSSAATKVCSSAESNGQARTAGSSLGAPPAGMTRNGDRFVVSEVTMTYHPIFPVLSNLTRWTFRYKKIWPVRGGEIYNGQSEVVLPGGKPCPA
ncbi:MULTISPECIES: TadE/TadG family type IV pilus assembly protein [Methylobacterium]|uniref:TadE/TadG family type IV pilus assembly protein n=1 Tax=Methylobacterium TaxID=407 RepID=UPI00034B3FB2|nr:MULTISPECIES: TadE/TadG family type IV pilus assembly protein [Methylobacterium]MBN4095560.1 pilus assembly protein [Methylobacterium sp. OT2]UIN37384.1 pilus assembly protein [Methylobacterium oryzae]SEF97425.1 Flp pilus assembly protein TadG [Methylobacterium sp. 190mf]SEH53937.1 Flp pilus assembly protein TadG [Methylobacterium sp. 275MFSha3.1]